MKKATEIRDNIHDMLDSQKKLKDICINQDKGFINVTLTSLNNKELRVLNNQLVINEIKASNKGIQVALDYDTVMGYKHKDDRSVAISEADAVTRFLINADEITDWSYRDSRNITSRIDDDMNKIKYPTGHRLIHFDVEIYNEDYDKRPLLLD